VKVVEYDPSRRGDVAELTARVWGERPDEEELAWFYEQNPVRPASVLVAEEDGKTVATVAISFVRMTIGGEQLEVGMPLRVATDAAYRGRGIFGKLQAENEERVAGLGVRLLLTVPNAASTPVFVNRLGWAQLPPLRVWARARAGLSRPRAVAVSRRAMRCSSARDTPSRGVTAGSALSPRPRTACSATPWPRRMPTPSSPLRRRGNTTPTSAAASSPRPARSPSSARPSIPLRRYPNGRTSSWETWTFYEP
jgi:predicted N-acetyltransferase YhbS